MNECMTEGCNKNAITRGLCRTCYNQARKLVKNHATSFFELETLGLILPPHGDSGSKFKAAWQKAKGFQRGLK